MSSFAPSVLDNLRLTHDLVAAIRAIGEGKGKQDLYKERAPEVLENLRQVAIIESTESSNRLEGITAPRTAIELLVRRNAEPRAGNRSEAEIAGYRDVLQLIDERHEHIEFTSNDLVRGAPGRRLGQARGTRGRGAPREPRIVGRLRITGRLPGPRLRPRRRA